MQKINDSVNPLGEFWQKMMGGGSAGGALGAFSSPPMSSAEWDKKIGDMKTVEQWMKTNLQMLQMTIHAMEMQRKMTQSFEKMTEFATGGQEKKGAESPTYKKSDEMNVSIEQNKATHRRKNNDRAKDNVETVNPLNMETWGKMLTGIGNMLNLSAVPAAQATATSNSRAKRTPAPAKRKPTKKP